MFLCLKFLNKSIKNSQNRKKNVGGGRKARQYILPRPATALMN